MVKREAPSAPKILTFSEQLTGEVRAALKEIADIDQEILRIRRPVDSTRTYSVPITLKDEMFDAFVEHHYRLVGFLNKLTKIEKRHFETFEYKDYLNVLTLLGEDTKYLEENLPDFEKKYRPVKEKVMRILDMLYDSPAGFAVYADAEDQLEGRGQGEQK